MPVSPEELVRLLAILAKEENLKVTVKETMKGGAMAGVGAVVGGFCGGPVGIAVGGTIGSLLGAYATQGRFESVPNILSAMDSDQRNQLYQHIRNIITNFDVYDLMTLRALLMGDNKTKVLNGLKGGTLGGMMARWKYKGHFRMVTDVMTELTKEQRDLLHLHFQPLLGDCIVDDFSSMTRLVNRDGEFRARMVQSLRTFVTDTLKLVILEEVITRGKAE